MSLIEQYPVKIRSKDVLVHQAVASKLDHDKFYTVCGRVLSRRQTEEYMFSKDCGAETASVYEVTCEHCLDIIEKHDNRTEVYVL